MNNTIYNDIKNIYKFVINHNILILSGLIVSIIISFAATIYSSKFISEMTIIKFEYPTKSFNINETKINFFESDLNILKRLNQTIHIDFLHTLKTRKKSSLIIKEFTKNKIFKNDNYFLHEIDFNQFMKLIITFEKKIFADKGDLIENISKGVILNWNEYKKYRYNLLFENVTKLKFLEKEEIEKYIETILTDQSDVSYTYTSIKKINYFNFFLIFLFVMFNFISIIMIKEIKNDSVK